MIIQQQKLNSSDTKPKTEDKNTDKNNTDKNNTEKDEKTEIDQKTEIDNTLTGNDENKTDVVMETEVEKWLLSVMTKRI